MQGFIPLYLHTGRQAWEDTFMMHVYVREHVKARLGDRVMDLLT